MNENIACFPERQLQPFAEPVSSDVLVTGEVYFAVTYVDDAMEIPIIETFVFIGIDLEHETNGTLYFQDVESHRAGILFGATETDKDANFFVCAPDQLKSTFRFENALDELMRCSLRRAGKAV